VKGLTPRQREVARLVRRGMTSREIADRLGISPRTVEVHRAGIGHRLASTHPLQHPEVQRLVNGLSKRVATLAAELSRLRAR
jgi:DNA-binding NarL/FixJ family response regulator